MPPPIYGITCCPQIEAFLKRQPSDLLQAIPYLIDPRMSIEFSEIYFHLDTWLDRCEEQRKWDAEH